MTLTRRQIPPMRTSTRRLSEVASHLVVPEGVVSTGWPGVRGTLAELGVSFDDWQQDAAKLILSKDAAGQYSTTVGGVVMSIPRQVGKTFLIGWLAFALCIVREGITVVWTAHRKSTADETFDSMKRMANSPKVAPHVERTPDNGSEMSVEFKNGSRVVFGARERGFGRGFTELHVVVFDEAQILTERSIEDMVPAQNAARNALTIMIGTPPRPIDPSEIFEDARRAALSGEAPDSLYVEFAADRKAGLDDKSQWSKANPSYPERTDDAAMLRMRRRLSEDGFRREALGIWDEMASRRTAFPPGDWEDCRIESPSDEWPVAAVGLDMNPERTWVTVSLALWSDDGLHLEVAETEPFSEAGTGELVKWIHRLVRRRTPVVIDAFSPARTFEAPLKDLKCTVRILSSAQFSQACMGLHDAVRERVVTHYGQEHLDASVAGATKKPVGKAGAWAFARDDLEVDLTPIMSVTCAHFGAVKFGRRPALDSESIGGSVVVC